MSHSSHVEIERKYEAGAISAPDFVGVGPVASADASEQIEFEAVYYDTEGLELAGAQIALRRRTGGSDAGWHVKLPASEGRQELGWPLEEGVHAVPAAVRAAVAEIVGDRPLAPIAVVRNSRTQTVLRSEGGAALAEFCDDEVRSQSPRTGASRRWREWELELREGAPGTVEGRAALLDTLESVVLAAGARVSTSSSKLARALGVENDA